jgi:type I restriction enzyme S subunit
MNTYPSYKDSGVEWIGEIPNGWNIVKTKYMTSPRKELSDSGKEELLSVSEYLGVIPRSVIRKGKGSLSRSESLIGYLKVYKGDLVNNIMLMWKKGLGVSQYDGIVSPAYSVFYFIESVPSYYHYLYRTDRYITEFRKNSTGVIMSRLRLYDDDFGDIPSVKPPLQEQQQISDYLDYKTSKIDTLIEKTQQKIELLKEQRTSLINTTVTKGLNPNGEMKDSGVEWIGDIPSEWSVKRLKYTSKILPSNVDKHIFPEEIQVRLCNYTDVYYNELIDENTQLTKGSCNQNEYNKFWLREGDVIITKDSETSDDIGIPTEVKENLTDVVCGYHLTLIRPLDVVGSYIFRFIQSDRIRRYFEINSDGVTRFGLGKPTIQNMYLPIPPLQEQQKIVDYLDLETSKIDKLVEIESKRIILLKEYRQSLISEVVTGKVDVRNEVLV